VTDQRLVQKASVTVDMLLEAVRRHMTERLALGDDALLTTRLDIAQERLAALVVAAAADVERRVDERFDLLVGKVDALNGEVDALNARLEEAQPKFVTSDPDAAEIAVLHYVTPFLVERCAIDVGAHRGRYARAFRDWGLETIAVEPHPELAAELALALPDISVRAVALDEAPGTARLQLAERDPEYGFDEESLFSTLAAREIGGLTFRAGPEVETTTLELLCRGQDWSEKLGILKIDVEGLEERVLRGAGGVRAEVTMLEFWGPGHPMAASGHTPALPRITGRLVRSLAIVHHGQGISFMIEPEAAPHGTWGNVFHFDNYDAFIAATRWCQHHLPEGMGEGR
jgi:FkbM family methyltransferase